MIRALMIRALMIRALMIRALMIRARSAGRRVAGRDSWPVADPGGRDSWPVAVPLSVPGWHRAGRFCSLAGRMLRGRFRGRPGAGFATRENKGLPYVDNVSP